MARRGGTGSGEGMAGPLIGVAISLLVFVVLEIFAPTIAGTIEDSSDTAGKETCFIGYSPPNFTTCDGVGNVSWPAQTVGATALAAGDGYSDWNTSHNTDLPTGVDTWTTVVQIIGVVFLVIAISIAIFYLKSM